MIWLSVFLNLFVSSRRLLPIIRSPKSIDDFINIVLQCASLPLPIRVGHCIDSASLRFESTYASSWTTMTSRSFSDLWPMFWPLPTRQLLIWGRQGWDTPRQAWLALATYEPKPSPKPPKKNRELTTLGEDSFDGKSMKRKRRLLRQDEKIVPVKMNQIDYIEGSISLESICEDSESFNIDQRPHKRVWGE